MIQCDVCIGKPDADHWCDICHICIHQCQCDRHLFCKEGKEGFEFSDKIHGKMLLKLWGNKWWLFYKHAEGQWVSLRKANQDDITRLGLDINIAS